MTMDELVKLVTQKFGLQEETAKQVVATVADSLKAKLPPPLAGQIDGRSSQKESLTCQG
jgi:hypothetical protein